MLPCRLSTHGSIAHGLENSSAFHESWQWFRQRKGLAHHAPSFLLFMLARNFQAPCYVSLFGVLAQGATFGNDQFQPAPVLVLHCLRRLHRRSAGNRSRWHPPAARALTIELRHQSVRRWISRVDCDSRNRSSDLGDLQRKIEGVPCGPGPPLIADAERQIRQRTRERRRRAAWHRVECLPASFVSNSTITNLERKGTKRKGGSLISPNCRQSDIKSRGL